MPADHQTAPPRRCECGHARGLHPTYMGRDYCVSPGCSCIGYRPATGERVDAEPEAAELMRLASSMYGNLAKHAGAAPRECGWSAGLHPIVHCELPRGHAGPHSFEPLAPRDCDCAEPTFANIPSSPWAYCTRCGRAQPGPEAAPPRATTPIRQKAEADPAYRPYCMRCSGLQRMSIVEPFYWYCLGCGAEHDERATIASSPRVDGPAGAMSEERLAAMNRTRNAGIELFADEQDALLAEVRRLRAVPSPEIGALAELRKPVMDANYGADEPLIYGKMGKAQEYIRALESALATLTARAAEAERRFDIELIAEHMRGVAQQAFYRGYRSGLPDTSREDAEAEARFYVASGFDAETVALALEARHALRPSGSGDTHPTETNDG